MRIVIFISLLFLGSIWAEPQLEVLKDQKFYQSEVEAKDSLLKLSKNIPQIKRELLKLIRRKNYSQAVQLEEKTAGQLASLNYALWWPFEEHFFRLLSRDWKALLNTGRYQRLWKKRWLGKKLPASEGYESPFRKLYLKSKSSIEEELARSSLNNCEKTFLKMMLFDNNGIDSTNNNAQDWLKLCLNNPRSDFVKTRVLQQYDRSLLGFGGGIALGFPFSAGEVSKSLRGEIPSLDLFLEFHISRLVIGGHLTGRFNSELDKDVVHKSLQWEKGDDASLTNAEIHLGIDLFAVGRWKFEPFAIWGVTEASNSTLKELLDSNDNRFLETSKSLGGGIRIFRRFGPKAKPSPLLLGLTLGYRKNYLQEKLPQLAGSEIFFDLILGFRGFKWKRK